MMTEHQNDDAFLNDLLQKIIKTEGLTDEPKISIKAGSEAGDGYVGISSAIEIKNESKILKLFAKSATKNETVRSQIFAEALFDREIFFYDTVYPTFLKFQLECNVKQPFNNVPRCYLTSKENLNETLIFENLKEQGYKLYGKKTEMNDQHILFIFKLYSRIHAISYVMKDQNPELYAKLTENLNDFMRTLLKTSGIDATISHYCEEAKKYFDSAEDSYISKRIENLTEILTDAVANAEEYADEFSVIIHGDCWCNNFLFKYKDLNDQSSPEDVRILDWQIMRVNSPVLDLSYFFYGIATKRTMVQLDFYLKTYHDLLSENIKEMGSDPEKLYPYHVFREHWKKFSRYGLSVSLFVLKLLLTENSEAPNTHETINTGKKFGDAFISTTENDELYKQRIKELVEHFVHNDFI